MEYSPETLLDEDQIFCLNNFSKQEYCLELLKQEEINTTDYNIFENTVDGRREFLVNIDLESKKFYFQKITASLLKPKRYILVDSQTKYEKIPQGKSFSLKDFPDAIYDKARDILFFRRLETISSIFDGIDELYIEATDDEVSEFLTLDIIDCDENFKKENVKSLNRKRIAQLKDKFEGYSEEKQSDLKDYIHKYSEELPFDGDKFKILSDQDLKKLIYGIEQRYFETEIDKERFVANSRIPI